MRPKPLLAHLLGLALLVPAPLVAATASPAPVEAQRGGRGSAQERPAPRPSPSPSPRPSPSPSPSPSPAPRPSPAPAPRPSPQPAPRPTPAPDSRPSPSRPSVDPRPSIQPSTPSRSDDGGSRVRVVRPSTTRDSGARSTSGAERPGPIVAPSTTRGVDAPRAADRALPSASELEARSRAIEAERELERAGVVRIPAREAPRSVPVPRAYRPADAAVPLPTRAADRYRAALEQSRQRGGTPPAATRPVDRLQPLTERYRGNAQPPITAGTQDGPGRLRSARRAEFDGSRGATATTAPRSDDAPAVTRGSRSGANTPALSAATGSAARASAVRSGAPLTIASLPTEPTARRRAATAIQAQSLGELSGLAKRDPAAARQLAANATAVAKARAAAAAAAIGAGGFGATAACWAPPPPSFCSYPWFWWDHPWYGHGFHAGWHWNSCWSFGLGWCWSPWYWKSVCHPWTWYGYPYAYSYYHSFWHPWSPFATSYVIYAASQPQQTTVIVQQPEPEVFVEEAPAPRMLPEDLPLARSVGEGTAPTGAAGLSLAAERYLTLGDRAFREARYADAVHFYARATEFAPQEGVLHLVLADALFATGDYRYAAHALRRAYELDPRLFDAPLDKHAFYTDPAEFDRQLAVLETYVLDHPADMDARLVLAANDYFGNRPAAAVDLLEDELSAPLAGDPLAEHLLSRARAVQYGAPAGAQ